MEPAYSVREGILDAPTEFAVTGRHCEERSDEAIQLVGLGAFLNGVAVPALDRFASLAMTTGCLEYAEAAVFCPPVQPAWTTIPS